MNNTGMILRSSRQPEHKETQQVQMKKSLPMIEYKGKIHYFNTTIDCAFECDKLLSKVNESQEILAIGFDMEWPFSYQTGSGKTALIQISPSLEECFLFHVFAFKNLPVALVELLSHNRVRLVGVNIKNDIHKLARDFPAVNSRPMLNNCIDSGTQAGNVLTYKKRWSMEALVHYFFEMQINKDGSVRRSKWNVIPLTKAQEQYAATDSYVSLKLYLHLKELEQNPKPSSSHDSISVSDILSD